MIKNVLFRQLREYSPLKKYLASYNGDAAVFNEKAPTDTDRLWGGEQYPRVVIFIDTQNDPERQVSGNLEIDVICRSGSTPPEIIESLVREAVHGYFFSSEQVTVAAQWNRSDYFTESTEKTNGVSVLFDLLAFPDQTTNEPDPILLINKFTKDFLKDGYVIGYDTADTVFKPSDDKPAVYWRHVSTGKCSWIPDTYACSWLTTVLQGHIFTNNPDAANGLAKIISHTLTIKKRLIFDDDSPLMVDRNIKINTTTDALRMGQIMLDATYGILYVPKKADKLKNVSVKERK